MSDFIKNTTGGDNDAVNMDLVQSFKKTERNSDYFIEFNFNGNWTQEWYFSASAARDTAFTAIETHVNTTTV